MHSQSKSLDDIRELHRRFGTQGEIPPETILRRCYRWLLMYVKATPDADRRASKRTNWRESVAGSQRS